MQWSWGSTENNDLIDWIIRPYESYLFRSQAESHSLGISSPLRPLRFLVGLLRRELIKPVKFWQLAYAADSTLAGLIPWSGLHSSPSMALSRWTVEEHVTHNLLDRHFLFHITRNPDCYVVLSPNLTVGKQTTLSFYCPTCWYLIMITLLLPLLPIFHAWRRRRSYNTLFGQRPDTVCTDPTVSRYEPVYQLIAEDCYPLDCTLSTVKRLFMSVVATRRYSYCTLHFDSPRL